MPRRRHEHADPQVTGGATSRPHLSRCTAPSRAATARRIRPALRRRLAETATRTSAAPIEVTTPASAAGSGPRMSAARPTSREAPAPTRPVGRRAPIRPDQQRQAWPARWAARQAAGCDGDDVFPVFRRILTGHDDDTWRPVASGSRSRTTTSRGEPCCASAHFPRQSPGRQSRTPEMSVPRQARHPQVVVADRPAARPARAGALVDGSTNRWWYSARRRGCISCRGRWWFISISQLVGDTSGRGPRGEGSTTARPPGGNGSTWTRSGTSPRTS